MINLEFKPKTEVPTDEYADYLLYSTCTGYALAEAMFYEGDGFQYFHKPFDLTFEEITDYHFWAVLPKGYETFAKKEVTNDGA
ncbi:hypothetical protein GCM10009007_03140 [Formosimonas limnophila]|uniref:Uncharacterized protein n=1 Tax=Formosimonas limnophila TaxID=1384487 RepID=A0A8J3CMB0_9BURK|nr:hypothetical protein [Formosimonas limnophila]GHA66069.1 hypothetical protein GCM10009007_03140 [Formosimonas limnophila]